MMETFVIDLTLIESNYTSLGTISNLANDFVCEVSGTWWLGFSANFHITFFLWTYYK